MSPLHVAAAAVYRSGQILLSRRAEHLHQGGKWEFPGGKLEQGESVQDALVRELREELDITATRFRPLIRVHHDYPDLSVLLDVWYVSEFSGEPMGLEGQEVKWFEPSALIGLNFPAANQPIVKAALLPQVLDLNLDRQFHLSEDFLIWDVTAVMDWQAFRNFTERAHLPVYVRGEIEGLSLERVWEHGGQGLVVGDV